MERISREEMMIYLLKSGYPHAPILVVWVNSVEDCGMEMMDLEGVKRDWEEDVYVAAKRIMKV